MIFSLFAEPIFVSRTNSFFKWKFAFREIPLGYETNDRALKNTLYYHFVYKENMSIENINEKEMDFSIHQNERTKMNELTFY